MKYLTLKYHQCSLQGRRGHWSQARISVGSHQRPGACHRVCYVSQGPGDETPLVLPSTLGHVKFKRGSCPLCFYFAPRPRRRVCVVTQAWRPWGLGGGWYQHGESNPREWWWLTAPPSSLGHSQLLWTTAPDNAETLCTDLDQNRNSCGGGEPRELLVQGCPRHHGGSSLPMCLCSSLSLSSFMSVNLFYLHQYSRQKCGTGVIFPFTVRKMNSRKIKECLAQKKK